MEPQVETLGSKLTSSEALESITAANNKQIGPCSNMRHAPLAQQARCGFALVVSRLPCCTSVAALMNEQNAAYSRDQSAAKAEADRLRSAEQAKQVPVVRCTLSAARWPLRSGRCVVAVA